MTFSAVDRMCLCLMGFTESVESNTCEIMLTQSKKEQKLQKIGLRILSIEMCERFSRNKSIKTLTFSLNFFYV